MAPLRGSFWVFVLYDVAEEIRIEKLRDLVGAEKAQPQPSFKHPAPEHVRFERPPAIEYPEPPEAPPRSRALRRCVTWRRQAVLPPGRNNPAGLRKARDRGPYGRHSEFCT